MSKAISSGFPCHVRAIGRSDGYEVRLLPVVLWTYDDRNYGVPVGWVIWPDAGLMPANLAPEGWTFDLVAGPVPE